MFDLWLDFGLACFDYVSGLCGLSFVIVIRLVVVCGLVGFVLLFGLLLFWLRLWVGLLCSGWVWMLVDFCLCLYLVIAYSWLICVLSG